jgi:phosphatidylglycerol:prolipoprotein diacylglycerol transferase
MQFHWYGLIVGVAVFVWWSLSERLERRVTRIIPWVLFGALVGARVYHVVDYWDYYQADWWRVLALWHGGLAIWGGVIGGMVALVPIFTFTKIGTWEDRESTMQILAAMLTPLPLAQAIGRVANGLNGEFTELIGPLPWWSGEMIADLILAVGMYHLYRRGSPAAVRVGSYLAGYGMIRFFLESLRERSWQVANLGVAQWIAGGAIIIGGALFIARMWQRDKMRL